ncbi:MAG: Uma2 family endonuclease [Actinomycetota bacterium]|nr:Uma2 family endonuclease [Actinomycetota bacterium]
MPILILDPPPARLAELLEHRRRTGADRFDEVWEGVYHMVPGPSFAHGDLESQLHATIRPVALQGGLTMTGQFNLGESEHDFRVPDGGLHRPGAGGLRLRTAALIVEILSPGDESWQKLSFYAAHDVDEVLIVDPAERTVTWLALRGDEYRPVARSGLVELGPAELAERLDWP